MKRLIGLVLITIKEKKIKVRASKPRDAIHVPTALQKKRRAKVKVDSKRLHA